MSLMGWSPARLSNKGPVIPLQRREGRLAIRLTIDRGCQLAQQSSIGRPSLGLPLASIEAGPVGAPRCAGPCRMFYSDFKKS